MNEIREQHMIAVELLKKLGLDYVRLEPQQQAATRYHYHAWTPPFVQHNGRKRSQHGVIRSRRPSVK
jgi:hypothetical protein